MLVSASMESLLYYQASSPEHIRKERNKAKTLRQSHWWKQKLGMGICHYCEEKFSKELLTMDHKIPIGRGGITSRGNVVVACKDCNNQKKTYTPVEQILATENFVDSPIRDA